MFGVRRQVRDKEASLGLLKRQDEVRYIKA